MGSLGQWSKTLVTFHDAAYSHNGSSYSTVFYLQSLSNHNEVTTTFGFGNYQPGFEHWSPEMSRLVGAELTATEDLSVKFCKDNAWFLKCKNQLSVPLGVVVAMWPSLFSISGFHFPVDALGSPGPQCIGLCWTYTPDASRTAWSTTTLCSVAGGKGWCQCTRSAKWSSQRSHDSHGSGWVRDSSNNNLVWGNTK